MKKFFTYISKRLDRLGDNDTALKLLFSFIIVCMAGLVGGYIGYLVGMGGIFLGLNLINTTIKIGVVSAAAIALLGCMVHFRHLWSVAGPNLKPHIRTIEITPAAKKSRVTVPIR